MEFKKPEMGDKEKLTCYFKSMNERSCELTFANTLLWAPHYHVDYCILGDFLVCRSSGEEGIYFNYPIGDQAKDIRPVIDELKEYCEKEGIPLQFRSVTKEMFARLCLAYPGEFEITYNRDAADYVYFAEKLRTLSGKKLHGKRNHINRFKENYPDWSYERITADNMEECLKMAQDWRIENDCEDDPEKQAEFCVTLNFLKHMDELGVFGGLIRAEGRIVAFSIGEAVNDDTLVVHIEKAFADVQGAYPMINQQFVEDYGKDYLYVNREEDMGSEGLRKAKLSYRPEMLIEKGEVTRIS